MISPLFKTTTLGFFIGCSVPILFTHLYYLPSKTQSDVQDLNLLKKVVNFLNWQVWKMEQKKIKLSMDGDVIMDSINNRRYLNSDNYKDGLYWAGF